ncbi:hypothetical protein [Clostridioides sp. ZZV14-6387]|uniref:hypothetical protein n=1 Tax=Clostridioides sp. ZZV14-6387 TaxID=2811497 RepID=UPI001D12F169|nr:hypothetical protein [Clostridioides sp. ZZV14-6387]
MSVKTELGKILTGSLARTGRNLVREMVQLPSLNFRYDLINKMDKAMLNGVHKALSTPANLIGEGKQVLYEARKNRFNEDINYTNTTQYDLNKMLQESQIQSHIPLYKQPYQTSNIGLAEQFASLELASNARRNIRNNFKR